MGSELDYGVVDGMGERMEFCIDRVCLELGFGEFPEMNAEYYVPLHLPHQMYTSPQTSSTQKSYLVRCLTIFRASDLNCPDPESLSSVVNHPNFLSEFLLAHPDQYLGLRNI